MLPVFEGIRDLTFLSCLFRLLLATVCGGLIGLERSYKRRPAGFRTHILICLGAAMTTLTSQYLYLYMHYFTDMARLGAQVIAGIGFIGAGTIITRRERVKGLTTAAGLWAAAIIGLCAGAGFFEGAILATALIELAELVFSKLEYRIFETAPEATLYMEYVDKTSLESVLLLFHQESVKLQNLEITRSKKDENNNACAIFSIRLALGSPINELIDAMTKTEGVVLVEEL